MISLGIHIKVSGFAYTHWTESESYRVNGKTHSRSVKYSAREDYLSSTTYLLGSPQGNEIQILPGVHTYNFACLLPQVIPSSFEGPYGHIRYTVKVTFERPWKFDLTYKVAFTVLKQVDLNYDSPDLRLPVSAETIKYFCCWPCKSGPMNVHVTIPIAGFVSGQMIPISVIIDNQSRETIDEITFKLKKFVKYFSHTPRSKSKEEKSVVVMKRSGGVLKNEKKLFQHNLLIPALPATNLNLCKIIQISYVLKVKPRVSAMHKEPAISIPITIGTVPLTAGNIFTMQTMNQNLGFIPDSEAPSQVQPVSENIPLPAISASAPLQTPDIICVPAYKDVIREHPALAELRESFKQYVCFLNTQKLYFLSIAPPSYEEFMYGSVQIEDPEEQHTLGKKPYTPRYPVYHFENNNLEANRSESTSNPTTEL